jgi:hypothetical protein
MRVSSKNYWRLYNKDYRFVKDFKKRLTFVGSGHTLRIRTADPQSRRVLPEYVDIAGAFIRLAYREIA